MGVEIQNDVKLEFKTVINKDDVDWKVMDYAPSDIRYKDYVRRLRENTDCILKTVTCYPDAFGVYDLVVTVPPKSEVVDVWNRCYPACHNVHFEVILIYADGSRICAEIQARRGENRYTLQLRHFKGLMPVKMKFCFLGELARE